MPKILQKELDKLKKRILEQSRLVEDRLVVALKSVEKLDLTLANTVIEGDIEIDHIEVEIEEECLKVLALFQPVAIDLRFIVFALKVNNDLERIGDLAVNIAERAKTLAASKTVEIPFDFKTMSDTVLDMIRTSMSSFLNFDLELAREVCRKDNIVDDINRGMYSMVYQSIRNDIANLESILQYQGVSRYLERVADHTTNIAEDVIYLIDGAIIRHQKKFNYFKEKGAR